MSYLRSRYHARSLALAILAVTAACSGATEPKGPPALLTELPRPLSASEHTVADAANAFSFSLFHQVNSAQRNENVFISPLSASMALGMTMNGAAGSTLDGMRTALAVGDASESAVNEGYQGLIGLLRGLDGSTKFTLANSIWYRDGFPVQQPFVDAAKQYFDARVQALDFGSASALPTINGWVSEQTNGKIPTILDEIRRDNVMFLINAIYFKGTWRQQFDKAKTRDEPFLASDGTTANVPTMHAGASDPPVRYAETADYTAGELLYGNGAWSMVIVVPRDLTKLDDVAASLTADSWAALVSSLHEAPGMEVAMPKFTMSYERLLNDDLKILGMSDAFDPGAADFSRLVSGGGVYIDFVKQKTFVDVNEEGTEAAAVTAVGIVETSAPATPIFRVDRAFLFVIRERLSGTVLFMGKIAKLPAGA